MLDLQLSFELSGTYIVLNLLMLLTVVHSFLLVILAWYLPKIVEVQYFLKYIKLEIMASTVSDASIVKHQICERMNW